MDVAGSVSGPIQGAADGAIAHPRLSLLGGFRIGDTPNPIGLPLPAQRLIAFLAIHGGQPSRDVLAESLWPGRSGDLARLNLRQAAYKERRASHQLIRATRAGLWLDPAVTVDLHQVGARLRGLLAHQPHGIGELEESDLLHDLLPSWDDDWLEAERESFRELRLHGLEMLSERWLQHGRWARAVAAALSVTAVDPLRESAHALLIRAHLGQRNHAHAFRILDSYRDRLRRELGAEPSRELTDLLEPPWYLGRR